MAARNFQGISAPHLLNAQPAVERGGRGVARGGQGRPFKLIMALFGAFQNNKYFSATIK